MSKLETNTIDTVSGTSNLIIGSTNTSTITMPNGSLSGHNYPAFQANLSAVQNISDVTVTKVQFDSEVYDTNSCYDNSTNYRFTPTVAGKYYIYSYIECDAEGVNKTKRSQIYVYKNDAIAGLVQSFPNSASAFNNMAVNITAVLDMNGSSDYIEIHSYVDADAVQARIIGNSSYGRSIFGAYRIGA